MCLVRITESYNPAIEAEAWKVFTAEPEGMLNSVFFVDFHGYPVNEWIEARGEQYVIFDSEPPYHPGFHAFKDHEGAVAYLKWLQRPPGLSRRLVIRKVKLRGVRVAGEEMLGGRGRAACYVAREMLILPEEANNVPDTN